MATIGILRTGQYFELDGRKYRVGNLIKGTNGYVACTDITEQKRIVRRFYIDTEVKQINVNECKHYEAEDGECFSKLDCAYKQADLNPDGTVNIYKCGKDQKNE